MNFGLIHTEFHSSDNMKPSLYYNNNRTLLTTPQVMTKHPSYRATKPSIPLTWYLHQTAAIISMICEVSGCMLPSDTIITALTACNIILVRLQQHWFYALVATYHTISSHCLSANHHSQHCSRAYSIWLLGPWRTSAQNTRRNWNFSA